ncbi:PilS domain-containing protein [Solidesulfovibrio carbinoliphilus subsp. oakridgensis]|uniref:PilS domain-containing protein n=1 Tax=Solidesulfovibrio carbinoliphilus subsp. oakridgensis TaxID=694327 RepID=G7QB74_9BACT|nr:type 4 pilus major pilin [Solidesulfovibrio carbinoliphilus]EHJ48816.1 PilS domain-containing protein [Solidesulfovibrio carbinoliphilus subsp. oakridgensis]
MTLLETLGAILVGLIVLAGAALGLNAAFSSSKLGETEQNLVTLRMQVQHMFSGNADYAGLDNALALKAGVVPKSFIKGEYLKNAFGGEITLAPVSTDAGFSIELTSIPQEECTKLAKFQTDAWLGVDVNGHEVNRLSDTVVSDIVGFCEDSNTILFTAR